MASPGPKGQSISQLWHEVSIQHTATEPSANARMASALLVIAGLPRSLHLADQKLPGRLPGQGRPGDGHRPAAPAQLGDPRGERRSVTELKADDVGASLKVGHGQVERSA